jgi:hypothetical protein
MVRDGYKNGRNDRGVINAAIGFEDDGLVVGAIGLPTNAFPLGNVN